ncbi:MAG: proprotein convertase P-domain-containing protein [Saprospiraceae bacterium]|nr:proprotein convertase P-domain-containing protein [Saprospiraceae bacterium]
MSVIPYAKLNAQCPRETAVTDYNTLYLPSAFNLADMAWTGDVNTCTPGTISQTVLNRNLQRINYYRKLVGGLTTNITFGATQTTKAQAAAFLMQANPDSLSHCPGNSCNGLTCATADGIEGAQNSNLGSGPWDTGYNPIDQWIEDPGVGNEPVGHRRGIFYSRAQIFGLGMTSNRSALWLSGNGGNPSIFTDFIAYPPRGYIIRNLVYPRWSFGIPGANFTNATVTMVNASNNNVPLNVVANSGPYGDPTVVWEPIGIITNSNFDIKYTVTVAGITGAAQTSYTYDVWVIPPVYPPTCPIGQEWVPANCQCQPVQTCLIGDLAATIRCTSSNTYDVDITVTYFNAPNTGSLVINGQNFGITTSPQTVTLPGLAANGNAVNVVASFSANGACSLTRNGLFTAPAAGACNFACPVALSGDTPKPIPDNSVVNSQITVGIGGTISDINIVDLKGYIDFPDFSDVKMKLTSPTGTTVQLLQVCNAINFTNTHFNLVFDDEAGTPVPCNFTTGMTFQPSGNLSDFDGQNPQGIWTFTIELPYSSGVVRSLDSWALEICTSMPVNCNTPPPNTGTIAAGVYQVTTNMNSGGVINSPSIVTFKAGNSIELNNGFEVKTGASFTAVIENCVAMSHRESTDFEITQVPLELANTARHKLEIDWTGSIGQTTIRYQIPTASKVNIAIFDWKGKQMDQIINSINSRVCMRYLIIHRLYLLASI